MQKDKYLTIGEYCDGPENDEERVIKEKLDLEMKDVDENYDNGNIEIFLAGFE